MDHNFNSYARHINCIIIINLNTTKNKDFLSKFLTFLKFIHLIIDNVTILFIYRKKSAVSYSYIPYVRPKPCPLIFIIICKTTGI